jgi:hypothetical protein
MINHPISVREFHRIADFLFSRIPPEVELDFDVHQRPARTTAMHQKTMAIIALLTNIARDASRRNLEACMAEYSPLFRKL